MGGRVSWEEVLRKWMGNEGWFTRFAVHIVTVFLIGREAHLYKHISFTKRMYALLSASWGGVGRVLSSWALFNCRCTGNRSSKVVYLGETDSDHC